MSNELSKEQARQVTEKAAIIANQAFLLGRQTEANRVIEILKTELELHKKGSSGRGIVEKIITLLSSKDKPNGTTN